MQKELIRTKQPIYRVTYHCSQACCRLPNEDAKSEQKQAKRAKKGEATDSESEDIEADSDDEEDELDTSSSDDGESASTKDGNSSDEKPKRQRPTKATRECDVELHVSASFLATIQLALTDLLD